MLAALASLILAAGLILTPASRAAPTAAQLANCTANVTGVAQPAAVKRVFCSEMVAGLSSIGARLGLPVIPLTSTPGADGFQIEFDSSADPAEPTAEAGAEFRGASPCLMVVFPRMWKSLKPAGGRLAAMAHLILLHEIVHCYQGVVWGSEEIDKTAPRFIAEGSAEYLGVEAAGYGDTPSWWPPWFNPASPQPSLLTRSYDAIGWYALVAQVEGSLWPRMAGAWRSFLTGGASAFIHALGGDSKGVETAWGPSLANNPGWGSPWVSRGVGLPHGAHSAGVFGRVGGELPAWSGELDQDPPGSGRLVLVRVSGGYGAVHDASGHKLTGIVDQLFCTDPRGCPVKDETCHNGTSITVPRVDGKYLLAVSSGATEAHFSVGRYSNVNSIPADISPCENGGSPIAKSALTRFAEDPCELLSNGDWDTATGIEPAESNVALASPQGGLCEWQLSEPVETDFLLGQAAIQERPWLELAGGYQGAQAVGGLGEQAFCATGHGPVQGLVPALYIELNSDWYLGVSGGSSCAAVTLLGQRAYARVAAA